MPFVLAVLLQIGASDTVRRPELVHANGRVPRSVTALFTTTPPRIDGRLDDPVWAQASVETGFRRDVPSDGNPATEATEIRVVYDRDALYIGARLHDARPDLISRRLNRRDSFSNFNDIIFVLIDSYHDHRTQFVLGVTAAGERREAIGSDDGGGFDPGWDPVWEARTSIDSLGWVAEMRIPFSQLRFPGGEQQTWGIQFRRDIVRAGEAVDWQWAPKSEPGSASKFGHLLGLRDIPAPRRLEFLPYASTQARVTEGLPRGSPFDDGSVASVTGGLDLKYGVTSNLTLTATINPDFGQVEADPSEVNLTAFETFFEERRPFFVEGASIFGFSGSFGLDQFFYSRRVGRAPTASRAGSAPYVDEPASASILAAGKLSGRTGNGWSIGALSALTGREHARIADQPAGAVRRAPIEPLANYGVFRAKRDLRGGRSGYGFVVTNVLRSADSADFPFLRQSASVAAADFYHRWAQNTYQLSGYVGASRITGPTTAIAAAQTSSARYFQRPDQDYVTFDPTRTSLTGYSAQLVFGRQGTNWAYTAYAAVLSPGFELNDAGFQRDADRIRMSGLLTRLWQSPGRFARSASASLRVNRSLDFGGEGLGATIDGSAQISTHALSSVFVRGGYTFTGLDDRATRGGPLVEAPRSVNAFAQYSSDQRKPVSGSINGSWSRNREGSTSAGMGLNARIRTAAGHFLSIGPSYQKSTFDRFYLATYPDPTASATFGRRYVFSSLEQQVLGIQSRLEFYFNPSLSLQVYAQPFVATAKFTEPAALGAPRSYRFNVYGTGGSTITTDPQTRVTTLDADGSGPAPAFSLPDQNFRVRSLRSNVVLRWEYRPGSTLFFVWNQSRFNLAADPRFEALRNLSGIFGDDMQNVFLVKANYYFSF